MRDTPSLGLAQSNKKEYPKSILFSFIFQRAIFPEAVHHHGIAHTGMRGYLDAAYRVLVLHCDGFTGPARGIFVAVLITLGYAVWAVPAALYD